MPAQYFCTRFGMRDSLKSSIQNLEEISIRELVEKPPIPMGMGKVMKDDGGEILKHQKWYQLSRQSCPTRNLSSDGASSQEEEPLS
jgi:hypothetical protein